MIETECAGNLLTKSHAKTVLMQTMLLIAFFSSVLVLSGTVMLSSVSAQVAQYLVSASPARIQEGLSTNITVDLRQASANASYVFEINVTAPTSNSYLANITVATDSMGFGMNRVDFLKDFANATTDYVGVYKIDVSDGLATSSFTVGLTDKLKYLRLDTVKIRGTGYAPNETVQVDIKFNSSSVAGFPKNVTASPGGVTTDSWTIPANAQTGDYTLTLSNATAVGTSKSPADIQIFTVEGVVEVQTRNLANEILTGALVEVYNATSGSFLSLGQETNETGWTRFVLETGNYTFKAFWNDVEVGSINQSVTGNIVVPLTVLLSNLRLTVTDDSTNPLPFVDLSLNCNFTTRLGEPISKTDTLTTNITGLAQTRNLFANISYVIEARRYGLLFNTTSVGSLPDGWNNITFVAPTYTMHIQVTDSKNVPAPDLKVAAYEWSSGIGVPAKPPITTDANGNATLSLTFGRYRLRVFQGEAFLNEVTVDLVQNQPSFVIRSDVYNVDLRVFIVDYFGQPIPNVSVEFQRKSGSGYTTVHTKSTGPNGIASFNGVVGGNSRVYISVQGRLGETQYLYLTDSKQVEFKLDEYVAIAGFILETSQFVTLIILIIIAVAFIVTSTYKMFSRLLHRRRK